VILNSPDAHLWFKRRRSKPVLDTEGAVHAHPGYGFLSIVSKSFPDKDLENDPGRHIEGCDITGFKPDILIEHQNKAGFSIVEIKPYDRSTLTPAQPADYIHCINWLNAKQVPCEYLLVAPFWWQVVDKRPDQIMAIQESLRNHFGMIWFEDIFSEMNKRGFKEPSGVSKNVGLTTRTNNQMVGLMKQR
jgi:hypothetical protein